MVTGKRERLKPKRTGFTQEAKIGDVRVCVSTGEYEDGRLGEVFIDVTYACDITREVQLERLGAGTDIERDAAVRAWANNFAILLSHAIQYGMPLEALVDQFVFTRFEPNGVVQDDDRIKMCASVLDYVFRVLGVHYLKRDELAQVRSGT